METSTATRSKRIMTDVLDSVRNSIRQGEPPENIAMQHEIPVSWVYEEMFNLAEIGESK